MNILKLILLLAAFAGQLSAVNSGTSNTYNVTAGGAPTFVWNINGVDQPAITSGSPGIVLMVGSITNGFFSTKVSGHGGSTITVNTDIEDCDFAFYEGWELKQEGTNPSYTPSSAGVTVTILGGGMRMTLVAASNASINVWAPNVQGMGGTPKKILLSKPGELAAQPGSKIKYRINGGGVSETGNASVQVSMPNGTASLEWWSTADGFADSIHQFTTWNQLMI